MFFAARAPERIGPWNVPEVIAGRPVEVSRVAVAAAVDPAGDRAVSRAVDRVASPGVNQAVSQVDSEPISRAAKVAPLAVADQVRGVHPTIVRNVRLVR